MPEHNPLPELDYRPSPSQKTNRELANELSVLRTQQHLALKTAVVIPMSTKEAKEYEHRSGRIQTIYRELVLLPTKVAI